MKTFNEFMLEHKQEVYISNTHGAHAQLHKQEVYISNTHGAHAQRDTTCNESTLPHISKYMEENEDYGVMSNIEKDHPLDNKGQSYVRFWSTSSRPITNNLLENHKNGTPLSKNTQENIGGLIDNATFPLKHEKLETYSGLGFDPISVSKVGHSKDGNPVYTQPTFMASSTRKEIAKHYAYPVNHEHHMFHWHHKKGDPIIPICDHSHYNFEDEVLIPPTNYTNNRLHIEHLGQVKYTDDATDNTYHVHHVRRIPESEIIKGIR